MRFFTGTLFTRLVRHFVLSLFVITGLTGSANAIPLVSTDRVWIRLESGFYQSVKKVPLGAIDYPTGNAAFDAIMFKYGVNRLEPLYVHDAVSLSDPVFLQLGMAREYRFICPVSYGAIDPIQLSNDLRLLSIIEDAAPVSRSDVSYTPNDWALSGMNSWGIDSCHARQAWDIQRGDSTILAVTIDTGVNYDHPDLFPNIAVNPLEDINHDGRFTVADNDGIDADGNGFTDDIIGWNFVSHSYTEISGGLAATGEQYSTRNNKPFDVHGHGTHVCGSIAARTDNATGVAAASFNVKTICLRAGFAWVDNSNNLYGSGYDDDFVAAIQYAILRGARIISISFGGSNSNASYQTAITYARNHNCLVLAAAGNSNTSTQSYPAAYTGVMAVAALGTGNVRASFSNYGSWVDICAPGVGIWSTMVNNVYHTQDYLAWNGTSMATPTAASVAALVLSRRPSMSSDTLEAILRRTAKNVDALNPGYAGMLGVGIINADSAARSVVTRPVIIGSPFGGESWTIGAANTITWSTFGTIPSVRIELNRTYPSVNWETIIASTANTGSFNWTVTGPITTTARIRITNTANSSEADTTRTNFTIVGSATTLSEFFEGTFPASGWRNAGAWGQYLYSGNHSTWLNYYNINSVGTRDSLLSPTLNLTGRSGLSLYFSTSYAVYSGYYDSLIVVGRYANGAWNSLWRQGGTNLSNRTGRYPTAWRQNQISIPVAYQTSGVQFAFIGYNGYGDNLYLDSIRIVSSVSTDWTQNQTDNSGPGNQNSWTPTLPTDPNTGGEAPAGFYFAGLTSGNNPTSISTRYNTRSNIVSIWGLSSTELDGALPSNTTIDRFWDISTTGGSGMNATVTLRFIASQIPPGITNPTAQITFAFYKHGMNAWASVPCVVTGPDGNGVYTATITGVSAFSYWGLGGQDVLPVELTAFTATSGDGIVNLTWRVESETQNRCFRIYRSEVVDVTGSVQTEILGRGTTSQPHTYRWTDSRVQNGRTYYYRLSDVSLDGIEVLHPQRVTATPRREIIDVPQEYSLEQNYPNPFNPVTTISFSLKETGSADLRVFNTAGREVAVLSSGVKTAGYYRVSFDGSRLPSGIYFYRLQTDEFNSIKKMMLVK